MTKHEIYIRVDYEGAYRIENKSNALRIAFEKDEPYDKLSRRFKKFIYKPRYPKHEIYRPSDYDLYIVSKNFQLYNYILNFLNPNKKIISVDVYYQLNDKKNYQPLIFGFNYESSEADYYTYQYLNGISYKIYLFPYNQRGSLPKDGCFNEDDLITRLLEEYGLLESTRYNKFLIKLEKRTKDAIPVLYPKSGNNKERITLKKSEPHEYPNYVKYEHSVDKRNNVEEFYIGFYNNTLFMFGNSGLGKLQVVDVYYNQIEQLVLIVFKFLKGSRLFKCSEFVAALNKTKPLKNIYNLPTVDKQSINGVLEEESSKFKHEIEFREGSRENVSISETNVCLKETRFFIVVLSPNIKEENKGSSIGPWIVYSGSLFHKNPDIKIDKTTFHGIYNHKFKTIDVYYNEKNEPLLVKFVKQSGNLYFVRKDEEGTKWEKQDGPSYGSDEISINELQNINGTLFTTLGIELEKKILYNNSVMIKSTDIRNRIFVIKQSDGPVGFKAEGYICCEHKLSDSYKVINTDGTNPKLLLEPSIGSIKIGLIGPNDIMTWPLTYTNSDHSISTKKASLFVYFSKNNVIGNTRDNSGDSDTLPLLFCYKDKFYSPKSKDQYFGLWIDEGVTGSTNEGGVLTPQKRLKEALDRNLNAANEIDLAKTGSYGIPCCSTHPYYYNTKTGFSTKRITVSAYKNSVGYRMYVHHPVKGIDFSAIKHTNLSNMLNQHPKNLNPKQKIDEVAVVFKGESTTEAPVLVLLNSKDEGASFSAYVYSSFSNSTTYGYYYKEEKQRDAVPVYKFKEIRYGSSIMRKLMGYDVDREGLPALSKPQLILPIKNTFYSIASSRMTPIETPKQTETDTSDCKGPSAAYAKDSLGTCHELPGVDKPTYQKPIERSHSASQPPPEPARDRDGQPKGSQTPSEDHKKQETESGGGKRLEAEITATVISREDGSTTVIRTSTSTTSPEKPAVAKQSESDPEQTKTQTLKPVGTAKPESPELTKQLESVSIQMDITDTTQASSYADGKVQFARNDYDDSDLFCFITHSLKGGSNFNITHFVTGSGEKIFTILNKTIEVVKSVNVYFNIYCLKNPLMIAITTSNDETKYYNNIIPDGSEFLSSNFVLVPNENFTQKLIQENDKINKTLTYQIEKSVTSGGKNTYGYGDGIKVTKNVKNSSRFTVYTHEPNKGQPSKSFVLLNQNRLITKTSESKANIFEVQDKKYRNVNIYYLKDNMEFPLIIELNESNRSTFVCRMDGAGLFWEKKTLDLSDDNKIDLELFEIFYSLKKSVIIEIDKKHSNSKLKQGITYPMKIISNKRTSDGQYEENLYEKSISLDSKNVEVSHTNNIPDRSNRIQRSFYYVSHGIESNSQSIDKKEIAGLRLFITNSVGNKTEEIYFYETQDHANYSKNSINLYYPPQSTSQKIFVYFVDDDPRPLLVSYDGYAYKRLKGGGDSKWVRAGKAKHNDFGEQLKMLYEIFETLHKKITLAKDGEMDTNINVNKNKDFGTFTQDIYSVNLLTNEQKTSFKLPINKLVENLKNDSSLYELLMNLCSKPYNTINVYKTSLGFSIKNILVFEFINDDKRFHIARKDEDGKYWFEEEMMYDDLKELQTRLEFIQSKVERTIVYEIDKKQNKYNDYISFQTSSWDFSSKYTKYSHIPQSKYDNYYGYILYSGKRLMVKNALGQIVSFDSERDDDKFKNVSVYFGSRKKDIPLIIEFTLSNNSLSKMYYRHIVLDSTSYWESIQISSRIPESKDLLTYLKLVEAQLFKSVIILMDIRKGKYNDSKINGAIPKFINRKEFNAYQMDDGCITVNDVTNHSHDNCLVNFGFSVFEHDINNCIKENNLTCSLRFFIPSNNSLNNYTELSLYDGHSIERLYYSKPDGTNKLYIYFYKGIDNTRLDPNEDTDPRPLLLFYGGVGYKPKEKDDYFNKWYKDSTIVYFSCQNPDLRRSLSESVGFLNEVQLEQKPTVNRTQEEQPNKPGQNTGMYDVQMFNGQKIKIEVSYQNNSCFRVYKHKPIGTGSNGSGFRLGDLKYFNKGSESTKLKYDLTKQLKVVSVYYYVYDYGHDYPLLVSLEFKDNQKKEYFELDDPRDKKWKIADNIDESGIESKIKSLYKSLSIHFNTGNGAKPLFDSKECYDDSNTDTIIKATSGTLGTLATVGTGIGVTAATHPEWFIPVIRALV